MRVTREEAIKMARVAKLSTSEEDIQKYQEKLEDLLDFVDTLVTCGTDLMGDVASTMKYDACLKEEMFAKDEDSRRIDPLS